MTSEGDAQRKDIILDQAQLESFRKKVRFDAPTEAGKQIRNSQVFSPQDVEMLRCLESDYKQSVIDTEIKLKARIHWARRSLYVSIVFLTVYLVGGIAFFQSQTDWSFQDTVLFAVYTATSAGYGHVETPKTPLFQIFDIFYILIGIASVAIMVAQVYQALLLEASRAQHTHDKAELAMKGLESATSCNIELTDEHRDAVETMRDIHKKNSNIWDPVYSWFGHVRHFFRRTDVGRFLAVALPLFAILLVGALVIGNIEGWTFIEGLYFAVVTMTTVGYGDYVPESTAGIVVTIIWLPCTIIFTSIYMGSVANWYLSFSNQSTASIEAKLREHINDEVDWDPSLSSFPASNRHIEIEIDLGSADDDDDTPSEETEPTSDLEGQASSPPPPVLNGTIERAGTTLTDIESISIGSGDSNMAGTGPMLVSPMKNSLSTMHDVIRAVHTHTSREIGSSRDDVGDGEAGNSAPDGEWLKFLAFQETESLQADSPCFALRVLVQERLAAIIAHDVAGMQSSIVIEDNKLSVTLGQIKDVAEKWLIPRRGRQMFRAAAFEAMFFVGEHSLIDQGAAALFELKAEEFHGIFSPLVAAMGDSETLEGWLTSTDILSDIHLKSTLTKHSLTRAHRKLHVTDRVVHLPKSQGTAFHS